MTGILRRGAVIGLSALAMCGAVNPIVARAEVLPTSPPSSSPPNTSSPTPSASTSYSLTPSDFSLTVSPTRLNVGQADINVTQKILAVNRGQAPVSVTVQKRNFTASTDGSLDYALDAPYAASDWVTVDPVTFDVEPGATQTVTASVQVPDNAEPGDHQVALILLVPPAQGAGNIKINRGIGLPMFITVPGPTIESASLSNLSAPGFAIDGPVPITATLHNTGTVHRDFRGDAPLRIDTAGSPSAFPDFTVPRDSVRDISTTWDPPLMCICNPTVAFTNADGSVQSATVRVIVFPLKLLGIVIGAMLVVLFALWFSRGRYRASVRKAALTMNSPAGGGDA